MAGLRLGVCGSLFGGDASSALGTVLGVWFEGLGLTGYLLLYLTAEPQIPQALRQLECRVLALMHDLIQQRWQALNLLSDLCRTCTLAFLVVVVLVLLGMCRGLCCRLCS